jgi:hypothetical protein
MLSNLAAVLKKEKPLVEGISNKYQVASDKRV